MGDRHDRSFKFLGGADSLLRVCGNATRVHEAVVGRDRVAGVSDVHSNALAGGVACSLAGPGHARFLPALLGGVNVVPLDHVPNVLVARGLEAFD